MSDTAPWTIRPYRPGDEAGLVSLFERVFGRPMSEAHWRWKLATRPSPAPNIFVAAMRDPAGRERLVGQCAAIPALYRGPQGIVTAMIAVDGMTDPDWRRQGLFTAVNRCAYDRWRDAGVPFVIGLPNDQWRSRTAALGWQKLFPLAWRIRPLRADRLAARRAGALAGRVAAPLGRAYNWWWRRRPSSGADVRIHRAQSAEPFDALCTALEAQRPPAAFTLVRDRAWFDWRYFAPPDLEYSVWLAERDGEPAGYCVSRLRTAGDRRVGYIAELDAVGDDATIYRSLIEAVVDDFSREQAELGAALAGPGTPADRALRAAGFLFSWGRFDVQAVPLQHDTTPAIAHVSGGDFDVV